MKTQLRWFALLLAALLLGALGAACSPAATPAPTAVPASATPLPLPPTATTAPNVATTAPNPNEVSGAQLFQISCTACHGADAGGNSFTKDDQKIEPPSLKWADLTKLYTAQPDRGTPEQQAALAVVKGQDETGADLNAMMPRWTSLSGSQVDILVAYLKAGPAAVTTLSGPAANLTGEQLFQAACAACHGKDGAGQSFIKDDQKIEPPSLKWADLTKLYTAQPSRGTPEQQAALAIVKGQDETGADLNAMMPRWTVLSQDQVDSLVAYIKATFK
jgi:mono/diheme cytochrome c family protein